MECSRSSTTEPDQEIKTTLHLTADALTEVKKIRTQVKDGVVVQGERLSTGLTKDRTSNASDETKSTSTKSISQSSQRTKKNKRGPSKQIMSGLRYFAAGSR